MNPMPKTLTLIRHAESLSNAGGITLPHDSIPLSSLGQRQAVQLADSLSVRPSQILVSTMIRTHQTAAPFCERVKMQPVIVPALAEFSVIDHRLIDGMDQAERRVAVKPYWDDPNPDRRLGDGADSFRDFDARVGAFQDSMAALPDATVVFGHGIWFGLLFWRLQGNRVTDSATMLEFRRFQLSLPMPNCAIHTLTHQGGAGWTRSTHGAIVQQ